MKRKELKALAQKIAKAELAYQNATSKKEKAQAEAEIIELSSHVDDLDDITKIDEMVQDILATNS